MPLPDPGVPVRVAPADAFEVHLENFSGPFDLLLGLIGRRKLDITEVALAQVTDEFIAHIRAMGPDWDLDRTSGFLVVAATLLDLKAARLLPSGDVEDEEDLALLEARDLLFARLLQYRAFKEVAGAFADRLDTFGRAVPRTVPLDDAVARLLPELVWVTGPDDLAAIAREVFARSAGAEQAVRTDHLHAPPVSVREQAHLVADRLRGGAGPLTFGELTAGLPTLVVVARFLALLELFRSALVAFDQAEPLAELTVRWTGPASGPVRVMEEIEEFDGASRTAGAPGEGDDAHRTRD